MGIRLAVPDSPRRLRRGAAVAVLVPLALVAAGVRASAQSCTIEHPPELGNTVLGYKLGVNGAPGAAHWLDCGYGTTEWDTNTSSIYCRYPANGNAEGTTYTWTATAAAYWDHSQVYCTQTGTITVYDCVVTCSAVVPATVEQGKPFTLQGSATTSHCRGDWFGDWKVFRSGVLWAQCPWESSCQVSLSPADTYDWRFEAVASWGDRNPYTVGSCVATGQVVVDQPITELRVGSLVFKAGTIAKKEGVFEYTLNGSVRVNDILQLPSPATFKGDPASKRGDLTVSGTLQVATAPGPTTILDTGGSATFWVDGTPAEGLLGPPLSQSLAPLAFKLSGVPLYLADSVIRVSDHGGVALGPYMYLGREGGFNLGALRVAISLTKDQQIYVSGVAVANGNGAPGVTIVAAGRSGDREFYVVATDTLSASVDVDFPFLDLTQGGDPATAPLRIRVSNGCVDALELDPEDPGDLQLRLADTSFPYLKIAGIEIAGICDAASFAPLFAGNLHVSHEDNAVKVVDSVWQYRPPRTLALVQGSPLFLGGYVGGAGATLARPAASPAAPAETLFLGGSWTDSHQALTATLASATLFRDDYTFWKSFGVATGAFTPAASWCTCPPTDAECWAARAVVTALCGGTAVDGVRFDVQAYGTIIGDDYRGSFVSTNFLSDLGQPGSLSGLSPLQVTMTLRKDAGKPASETCEYNRAMAAVPAAPVALRPLAAASVERSFTLDGPAELAIFAAVGAGAAVPTIHLLTPGGSRLTPVNVAGMPAVTYAADAATATAAFAVASAAAGTWTLGVDDLPESDVTLMALVPRPRPQVAFTRVEPSGTSVAIGLAVSPPSPTTAVSLFYSHLADGTPEGAIASDLPAGSGAVSAAWDTAALPTGSYFVLARTDDGHTAPVTTVHPTPVEVVNGALEPPTGLAATRTSDTATLTWTPSLSAEVVGYAVHYTGDPDAPDYPESTAAALPNGATVSGLDPRTPYRFCVAAYAADGTVSPCSASVALAPTLRLRRVVQH